MRKPSRVSLLFLGVTVCSIGLSNPPSIAENSSDKLNSNQRKTSIFKYNPPSRKERHQQTRGAGSRGCKGITAQLTLLTSSEHIGLTAQSHPTFIFHLSDSPQVPVIFSLVEPGVPEPVLMKELALERGGYMAVKLPSNLPGLKMGKQYRWNVSFACNPNRPSEDIFAEAWVERVELPEELTKRLASAITESDRAALLADRGIWYDALSTAFASPDRSLAKALLKEIKLSEFEFPNESFLIF